MINLHRNGSITLKSTDNLEGEKDVKGELKRRGDEKKRTEKEEWRRGKVVCLSI